MSDFLVGLGVDHHVLREERLNNHGFPLTLGGYVIPDQSVSLDSNCDGDVLIHALCNALSTALGDGSLAPTTDALCGSGIKYSRDFLAPFLKKIRDQGYSINNISASIEAQKPHLEEHRSAITASLSEALSLDLSRIGISFTTGEGLTACGRGKGIYAQVICSLTR
ncbi:2-C-methyl-D-erythritol 2,4-cyclodiphosphate synthase [Microgenomates group bacterium]|nr:2-C-methyl-D-erythritol 2,4-cyclodiphosphate synthase [Microgenomates group bacterium]